MAERADISLTADFQLSRDAQSKLQQAFSRIEKNLRFNVGFNNLTRDLGNFSNELNRANQRVITLGTSFLVLSNAARTMRDIVTSTIEVEKAFIDVNAILKVTDQTLGRLNTSLFDTARSTAKSFDEVARVAQELARQGLSVSETQKRTRDALILSRDAGIDATDSLRALTSALNSFNKEALTSQQVVNRLAVLDAAYAVSSKDLQDALIRVGSAASDAGVSFNQLIGLVTSAQQITARGGTVIAGALNTIFTHLERKDTLDALEGLGVTITDLNGRMLPTLQILSNFSSQYDKMTGSVRESTAELVGGVRQLNTLKALLGDIGKSDGIFAQNQQLLELNRNSEEAYRRNLARNKSLDSLVKQLAVTDKQIYSNIGVNAFAGPSKNVASVLLNNPFTQALEEANGQAESAGGKFAEGFLHGFGGAVIFGLGPLLLKALFNVASSTFRNVGRDFVQAAGLTKEDQLQESIQRQIVSLYKEGGDQLQRQLALMSGIEARATAVRYLLSQGSNSGQATRSEITQLASILQTQGYRPPRSTPRAAGGYVPIGAEASMIAAGVGGAPTNARPVYLDRFNRGDGQYGIVANTSEWMVPGVAGGSIFNRDMIQRYGLPAGSKPVAAGGYVPNAATGDAFDYSLRNAKGGTISGETLDKLNTLFSTLQKAGTGDEARKLSLGINELVTTLNSSSSQNVRNAVGSIIRARDRGYLGTPNAVIRGGSYSNAAMLEQWIAERDASSGFGGPITSDISTNSTQPFGPTIPLWYKVRKWQQQRLNGVASRQVGLNASIQNVGLGVGFFDAKNNPTGGINPIQQTLYTNELRRKAAQQLGFDLETAYFNRDARSQVNALIAPKLAAARYANLPPFLDVISSKASPSILERFSNRFRSPGGQIGIGLGLGFAGGLVPEGKGGTKLGVGLGALGSGLSFAATGLALGGPVGGLIGGSIGALSGALSKVTQSFDELAHDIDQSNKRLNEQITNASEVFRLRDEYNTATDAGSSKNDLASLRQQETQAVAGIRDKGLRSIVLAGGPNAREQAFRYSNGLVANQRAKDNISLAGGTIQGGFGNAFNLFNDSLTSTESEDVSDQLSGGLSKLSSIQLAALRSLAKTDPRAALAFIGKNGGLKGNQLKNLTEQLDLTKAVSSRGGLIGRAVGALTGIPVEAIGELSGIANRNTGARATQGILSAINDLVAGDEQVRKNTRPGEQRIPIEDIGKIISIFKRGATFGQIESQGAQQLREIEQQALLSNPSVTEADRPDVVAAFGRENISREFAAKRNAELSTGQASLTQLLASQGIRNPEAYNRIAGLNSSGDIRSLIGDLKKDSGPFANKDIPALIVALQDVVDSLDTLDKTENVNIKVTDAIAKAANERYQRSLTLAGATDEDKGAIKTAQDALTGSINRRDDSSIRLKAFNDLQLAIARGKVRAGTLSESEYDTFAQNASLEQAYQSAQRSDRATISLGNQGSRLVGGNQLESAVFNEAKRSGQRGDTQGSLTGGFQSVFAGAKRDILDFSDIGQRVGQSLEQNLGNAFGDFVTGAKRGKDAFRDFAISVLNDASRMLASKALTSVLSLIPGFAGAGGGATTAGGVSPISPDAKGGRVGFALGGMVPSMVMGGEIFIGPKAARSIGYSQLSRINNGYSDGGEVSMIRGGSGVKDDIPANMPSGSFIVRKNVADKLGPDYFRALAGGQVQHRFLGGLLLGALIGGGVGYATGGKKGAVAGALIGATAGGLYSNHVENAASLASGGSKVPLSIGEKATLSMTASAGLGAAANAFTSNPSSGPGPISDSAVPAYRAALEAAQASEIASQRAMGNYPYLQGNSSGGQSLGSYGAQVGIKIEINNQGGITSSSSNNGNALSDDGVAKLKKLVQGWTQEELVNQSKSDGFFAQRSRFINRF